MGRGGRHSQRQSAKGGEARHSDRNLLAQLQVEELISSRHWASTSLHSTLDTSGRPAHAVQSACGKCACLPGHPLRGRKVGLPHTAWSSLPRWRRRHGLRGSARADPGRAAGTGVPAKVRQHRSGAAQTQTLTVTLQAPAASANVQGQSIAADRALTRRALRSAPWSFPSERSALLWSWIQAGSADGPDPGRGQRRSVHGR